MVDIVDTSFLLNSFIEALARITSYALTDKEKESVVRGFRQFHQQLERISSSATLRQLAIESKKRKEETVKCHHEGKTCSQNAIRGFLKSFLVGYAIKYGLDVAPHLVTLRLFTRPSLLLRGFSRDTFSFASFLSVLIGSYKAFLCLLRHYRGSTGNDYTNALAAGMLSGLLSVKLDRSRSRRAAITLYMVSRALQYGCVWLFNRWVAEEQRKEDVIRGKALKRSYSAGNMIAIKDGRNHMKGLQMTGAGPTASGQGVKWSPETVDNSKEAKKEARRSELARRVIAWIRHYSPTALMSVSCCIIALMAIFQTDVLPRGYLSFLAKASGYERFYPKKVGSALKSISYGVAQSYKPGNYLHGKMPLGVNSKDHFAAFPLAKDITPLMRDGMKHDFVTCGILHPQTPSCTKGALYIMFNILPLALRIYTPLNAAVLVLFKRGRLMQDPKGVLLKLAKSSIRSSIFLSILITSIINGSCTMRALLGRETYIGYVIMGLVGGLSVLIEAPSRRIELAMYCFLRALESGWDVGVKYGVWRNVRHGEVALFSAAMGILMSIYQNDPSTFNITYHSILTRVFGKN
ncbi:hypothetical protein GQ54DRAFT_56256 [Martensiomyces pterosporus]|nr:hypothetical protein GQ54DRAFT_56256 [Martensiomyces pterosporus]